MPGGGGRAKVRCAVALYQCTVYAVNPPNPPKPRTTVRCPTQLSLLPAHPHTLDDAAHPDTCLTAWETP